MFESLGLARDPFSPAYDACLHVEPVGSVRAGKTALAALSSGRSFWVRGPKGSGRESFLAALSEKLSGTRPVIVIDGGGEAGPVLSRLHAALAKGLPPEKNPLSLAEEVYGRLLDGLWRGAPVVVFTRADSLSGADFSELEILADLEFMGEKLATVAACGEGEAPPFFGSTVDLGAPQPEALAEMVRARLGLCGGAGLLEEEVDRIANSATGFSDALRLSSLALGRRRYELFTTAPTAPEPSPGPSVFPADALGEVGRLLDEISAPVTG